MSSKKERMKQINRMLLEMASGNFFYRLQRTAKNDNLEAISISLNMLAEEIQDTLLHQGYANSNNPIVEIIQMSIILNDQNYIEMLNQEACNILSILYNDALGHPFENYLHESSKEIWLKISKELLNENFYDYATELKFKTRDNLIIPKQCFITLFKGLADNERKTLITVIHHSNKKTQLENDLKKRVIEFSKKPKTKANGITKKPKIRLSFEDIRKIRKGRDLIINNLEKDLPSLKEFALQLGTNEFKLKYGFKELFGTSVFRFLTDERLRKSQMMIQYSDLPIKSIAHMNGFKSMSHFSRTFKNRYGYSPSELRKKSLNRE